MIDILTGGALGWFWQPLVCISFDSDRRVTKALAPSVSWPTRHAAGFQVPFRNRERKLTMSLGSHVKSSWRIARDAFAHLNRLLAEPGNSDEDLVFQIRRSQENWETSDLPLEDKAKTRAHSDARRYADDRHSL